MSANTTTSRMSASASLHYVAKLLNCVLPLNRCFYAWSDLLLLCLLTSMLFDTLNGHKDDCAVVYDRSVSLYDLSVIVTVHP